MSDIVQKLWGFCHTLRHDGVDYGDYIEQLTYLLFLKMADEKAVVIPKGCDWESLKTLSGTKLTDHYSEVLRKLREAEGLLGAIFTQATSRFNNPVNLRRLIDMIDEEEWSSLDVDVKGAAFEGLLEKAASEGKKGAGQYFTPRPLIQSICRVMKPDPRGKQAFAIDDPACGTGGFLVASYEWLVNTSKGVFDRSEARRIRTSTYYGQELVARPRRLALMNLYLHGVEPRIYLGDTVYEPDRGERYDVVLTNPPFGTKGANQAPDRDDFTIETSNKQLNFVQHVMNTLKPGGRAAMVLPDNCLFEGKAGEVFQILMQDCNLHTVLRLPRGTFTPYSQGVKANVIFFQKGRPTEQVWIFDGRSNVPGITKKDRPLTKEHFKEFEECYGKDPNGLSKRTDTGETGRFRKFSLDEIKKRDYKLDITWLKDESLEENGDLPDPQDLAAETITELEAVADGLRQIVALVEEEKGVEMNDELPQGWTLKRVGDIFKVHGGGTPDRGNPVYWSGNVPWLSSGDIKSTSIFKSSETITKRGLDESAARLCRKGSVLVVVRSGILKHTLPVAVLEREAAINQDIKAFDSGDDQVNAWLALAWRVSARELLAENREGTTVQSVKIATLEDFELPVPPLPEQQRIFRRVQKLFALADQIEARFADAKRRVDSIKQSILAKAFRGELVPTEYELAKAEGRSFESAEELLERIRGNGQGFRKEKRSRD